MNDQKPLFKAPYDIKDVSALFAIVAFVLIIAAIVGNNLFGLFQANVNFAWKKDGYPSLKILPELVPTNQKINNVFFWDKIFFVLKK